MSALIDARGLSKYFDRLLAVDNLSLEVHRGEVLGFLGPNGAGKSTTMRMITGYLTPDSGTVRIGGVGLDEDPKALKKLIGFLPEGAPAYEDMTVRSFLRFIGEIRELERTYLQERLSYVVEKTSLQSVLHQPIETLSKGFKRRVGLAQAILHDPQVLIMDEPTDGLDPNQKRDVRELIKTMAKDKAIIISTHILEEVEAICNRVVVISGGKVVGRYGAEEFCNAEGGPNELFYRLTRAGGAV